MKIYLDGVSAIGRLPVGSAKPFLCIAKRMAPNNIARLDRLDREEVAIEAGIAPRRVLEQLKVLVDKEALYRISRGRYMVNPYIAVKRRDIEAAPLKASWDRLLHG